MLGLRNAAVLEELTHAVAFRAGFHRLDRDMSAGHRKIILYANPGKEGFYRKLGFLRMRTAIAIFKDQKQAISGGLVDDG